MWIKGLVLFVLLVFAFGCAKENEQKTKLNEATNQIAYFTPLIEQSKTAAQVLTPNEVEERTLKKNLVLNQPKPELSREQKIQLALRNAGFYKGGIDGKIGPLTKKAIKIFQATHKLKVDGKVGVKTWAKLRLYLKQNE